MFESVTLAPFIVRFWQSDWPLKTIICHIKQIFTYFSKITRDERMAGS